MHQPEQRSCDLAQFGTCHFHNERNLIRAKSGDPTNMFVRSSVRSFVRSFFRSSVRYLAS